MKVFTHKLKTHILTIILMFSFSCHEKFQTLPNGQIRRYYLNSNLKEIVSYKGGKKNGIAFYFYKNGTLKSTCYWKNDSLAKFVNNFYDDTVWKIKSVILYDENAHLAIIKKFNSLGKLTSVDSIKK